METRSIKRARTDTLAPATLTTLPPELVYHILEFLDNKSWLQLAIACRPFLHAYAQLLDPWNAVRKRLFDAVGHESFNEIQRKRLDETGMRAIRISDYGWPAPTPSLLCTFIDYVALDKHRRSARYIPTIKISVTSDERLDAWTRAFGSPDVAPFLPVLDNALFELEFEWDTFKLSSLNTLESALCCRATPLTTLSIRLLSAGMRPWKIAFEAFLNGLRSNETLQFLHCNYFFNTSDAINASFIDAVAGHARVRELEIQLTGPRSVKALVRLLRFGAVKLEKLTLLSGNFRLHGAYQMTILGEALAANATIKTLQLTTADIACCCVDPFILEVFLNGYHDADRSHSVLRTIFVQCVLVSDDEDEVERVYDDVRFLKHCLGWSLEEINVHVEFSVK